MRFSHVKHEMRRKRRLNAQEEGGVGRLRLAPLHSDDILSAATQLFSDRGYASATMHDLAVEAQVELEALQEAFADMEAVLEGLLARTAERSLTYFQELDRFCESEPVKLYLAVAYDVEVHARFPDHLKLNFMMPELRQPPYSGFDNARRNVISWYEQIISCGVKQESFRPLETVFTAWLISAINEAALDTSSSAPALDAAEQGMRVADFTMTALLAHPEELPWVREEALRQRGVETTDEDLAMESFG